MQEPRNNPVRRGEEGFMLLGAVVLVFLLLLTLSVAAAKVARELRREREVEAIHRGNEYVRALQLYYRKNGIYPGNMEQLEKSNNIRYLRQKYIDPMTGKADWRLIHQGEAKTTVKGFFGKPLAGMPGGAGGLGSAASMVSSGQGTSTVSGSSSTPSSSSSTGGFSLGTPTSSPTGSSMGSPLGSSMGSPMGSSSGSTGSTVASSTSSSSGVSSQSATSFTGGGGPIVGFGSSRSGSSITVLNEQTTYQTWEFLYDPRIEQLKANAALLGGVPSTSSNSLGSGTPSNNSTSPFGAPPSTTPPTTTPSTTTPQ
jgi:hypothetical protein